MNANIMAARRVALLNTVVLTLCLALFPMTGLAKAKAVDGYEKANLVTVADFIEYSECNDVDIHGLYFDLRPYEGTKTCLMCHEKEGTEMLSSGHFTWEGNTDRVVGLEGESIGKNNLLNNFCVAVPTNEERCAQCHAGYGMIDNTFDFTDPLNIDCLVCHDQSGTYAKDPKNGGMPANTVDLQVVAASIRQGSKPTRKACMNCHAKAGGGDNVKHGDLATTVVNTTREYDVHMGTDGADMSCVQCHGPNHDQVTGEVGHGMAGMPIHSVNEGTMKQCSDCHGDRDPIHAGSSVEPLFAEGWHDNLACQVCHIPAIARNISTKVEWYWADAGQDISPIPIDPDTGRPTYDKKKGTFVWANDVRPTLRFSNGYWNRKVTNLMDTYDSVPIDLGSPVGDYTDPNAMIYPFKLMIGNQPVDLVNKRVMVPHLFKTHNGPNPYWGKYDWNLSIIDGAAYTGQEYSGTFGFEDTTMLLTVNHEVAPKEMAYGMDSNCGDCHASEAIDWQGLGWTDDPFNGGSRVPPSAPALKWVPPLKFNVTIQGPGRKPLAE